MRIEDMPEDQVRYFTDLPDRDLKISGICIAEGKTVIDRLLSSPLEVEAILCTKDHVDEYSLRGKQAGSPFPVYTGTRRSIGEIVGYMFHRGLLAAARRPQLPNLGQLCRDWKSIGSSEKSLFWGVNISPVQETSNVGTLIRTAKAFGARAIVLGPGTGDPFSRKAVRSSVGHVFGAPLAQVEGELQFVQQIRANNLLLVVADAGPGSVELQNAGDLIKKLLRDKSGIILSLGHEFAGHSDEIQKAGDLKVRIPMNLGIDSLNVAAAGAVFCYALASGLGFLDTPEAGEPGVCKPGLDPMAEPVKPASEEPAR